MTAPTHELSTDLILRQLRSAVVRDHRKRQRRFRVAVIAFALFLVTSAAVGATRDWWTGALPATNKEVVQVQLAPTRLPNGMLKQIADPALARTVARAPGAALVAAPTKKGGYCLLPQLPRTPGDSVVGAGLSFTCTPPRPGIVGGGSEIQTLAADSQGAAHWYVYGRITDATAASIDLTQAAGTALHVKLGRDGFFMASLPESTWQRLDERWDDAAIVGADGRTIRETCVAFGPAPFSRVDRHARGGGLADGGRCAKDGPTVQAPPTKTDPVPAPTIHGIDVITGDRVRLADLAGKPVIIQFWNVCDQPGCDATSSFFALEQLRSTRDDVAVIAIHESAGRFPKELVPGGFPHLTDPSHSIARAFGVDRYPALLFLDPGHRIRAEIVGVPTDSELMRGLRMATSTQ